MRSAVQQAGQNVGTGQAQNNSLFGASQGIGATLVPGLTQQFTNPTGINPVDRNDMLVHSQQGAGGAASSIVGQGALNATRTGNSSALPGLMDTAARAKTAASSNAALGIDELNAKTKLGQQENAGKELAGLYGTDLSGAAKSLGLSTDAIKEELDASQTPEGWESGLTNFLGATGSIGKAGMSMIPGMGKFAGMFGG